MPELWRILIPLLAAHLLTDFLLQSRTMVVDKSKRNFSSPWLYIHALVAGATAYLLTAYWEFHYIFWVTAISHLLIDGWKNSMTHPDHIRLFFIDQALHLFVIAGLMFWIIGPETVNTLISEMQFREISMTGLGLLFLLRPSSVIIQKLIQQWDYLPETTELPGAGHYIGMLERTLLFIFVLFNQFAAIGLLIAAKSIMRYGRQNQDRKEAEYILVGTLLSFTIAIVTGLLIKLLI